MEKTRLTLLTLAVAAVATLPAAAQEFVTPLVSDFEDERYEAYFANVAQQLEGQLENGTLVVVSEREAGDGRLANYTLHEEGPISVFVDVSADFTTPDQNEQGHITGAGIIIKRSASGEPMSFYGLLLQEDGYLAIVWAGGNVTQRIGGSLPEGSGETVRLAASEVDNAVQFYVDGNPVAKVSDSRVTGKRAGLVVLGGGTVVFDNFGMNARSDIGSGEAAQEPR